MKIQSILLLYDALISGEVVSRTKFCAEHNITERTYYRYLKEIICFLRTYKSDCVVDISDAEGGYFIKKCNH